ncbi:MAG: T9SS type A sorting domain-containing protein [Flavobacterium sp.]
MKKITLFIFIMSSLVAFAQPTNNAPDPTNAPADVISIYGGSFTSIATNFDPNWGQSGHNQVNPNFDPGTGNLVLAYPNFNYQGTELITTNASAMEFLHVDVWTNANPTQTTLQVSPINNGGVQEVLVTIPFTSGTWTSIDIPKSAFTGMTWNNIFQMKFAANGPGSVVPITIYLDNIYFWKAPINPADDATLSNLQVDGTTVAGFSPATLTYNVGLPNGTTTVPQITSAPTANPAANSVITQAPALPGSATVVVTSENSNFTNTYTVNFTVVGPSTAAPTPPARPAEDVKSIFSDAYTPIGELNYQGVDGQPSNDNTFNTSWCPANTSLVQVQGNNTNLITGLGCEGIAFLDYRFDASEFTFFHMDIYTDSPTQDKSFNIKFSNWNGGTQEANAWEFSFNNSNFLPNTNPGTWISLDIPMSSFTCINTPPGNACPSKNDFAQFVITSNLGTVYYDNLYLHKNTVMSVSSFEKSNIKMFPNPATTNFTIDAEDMLERVVLYNMLGQAVINVTPNNQQANIDISGLQVGVYVVKATVNGVESTTRLVKK